MQIAEKPNLEVCLSPALLHLFNTANSIVVVIDIFRATSTIAASLDNGAKSVIPVASVAKCIELGKSIPNSITAGERDGKIVEGLQYGNSPLAFHPEFIRGKTLILTTTNGTRLLHNISGASSIVMGSFLNLSAICKFVSDKNKNLLLACASWKDKPNLEDTIFAGAVISKVQHLFHINCDSARLARHLYNASGGTNFLDFLKDSSHYRRLSAYGLEKDLEYCTTTDLHPVVPILKGEELVIA